MTNDSLLENQDKFICLAWGSLVWDGRDLPITGIWHGDGPFLPLEFARQSADGRMTLVIVEAENRLQVLWARLDVHSLDRAVFALTQREGVPKTNVIGRWPNGSKERYPYEEVIGQWVAERRFVGAVWTALPPGMKGNRGAMPTLDQLKIYLAGLEGESKSKALDYILRAPQQIAPPYRSELETFASL